jgi:hypothetical protein
MRSRTSFFPAALSVALFVSGSARALPKLEEPVSLPPDFNGVITIYPDSDNTKETKKFWLVPSTARVVRKPDGKLEYGLVHSGISGLDKDGISAQLTVTLQPWVDDGTLQKAKKLIEATEKANGAKTVTFSFISPIESTCQLLVAGQFIDWDGAKSRSVVKGGTIEAGTPFQVKLDKNLDARALAQAGGPDACTLGVRYTMKFNGRALYDEVQRHWEPDPFQDRGQLRAVSGALQGPSQGVSVVRPGERAGFCRVEKDGRRGGSQAQGHQRQASGRR